MAVGVVLVICKTDNTQMKCCSPGSLRENLNREICYRLWELVYLELKSKKKKFKIFNKAF